MIGRLLLAAVGAAVGLALLGWALSFTTVSEPMEVPDTVIPAPEIRDPRVVCSSTESEIRKAITDARACSSDAECVSFNPGCPFGCRQAVNQQDKASLLDRIDAHRKGTCPWCIYKCLNSPGRPTCHDGQCRIVPLPEKAFKPVG